MKRCPRCGLDKALDEFSVDRKRRDGRQTRCRDCQRTINAGYYARYKDEPAHQEKSRANARRWAAANPEKRREYNQRREALKKGATRSEKIDRQSVYEFDRYICWICGEYADPGNEDWKWRPSLDHVVALMDGGDHTYENLRTAHRRCNTIRGVRRRWERKREGLPDTPTPDLRARLAPLKPKPEPRPRRVAVPKPKADPRARLAPLKVKPEPKDPLRQKPGATVCRNGHPLIGDNLMLVPYKTSSPRRRCRICQQAKSRRKYAERRNDPEFMERQRARARDAAWAKNHPEQRVAWRAANRERENATQRARYAADGGRRREQNRRWIGTNRDQVNARRRALTPEQRSEVNRKQMERYYRRKAITDAEVPAR